MTLRDKLASLVRTGTPYLVGLLLTWLGRKYGVVLDDNTSAQISSGLAVLAGSVYYLLVRLAEAKWQRVGWLLGWNVPPTYEAKAK
jgi:hypothetical protein